MEPDTDDSNNTDHIQGTHIEQKPQKTSEPLRNSKGSVEGVKRMGYG